MSQGWALFFREPCKWVWGGGGGAEETEGHTTAGLGQNTPSKRKQEGTELQGLPAPHGAGSEATKVPLHRPWEERATVPFDGSL